MRASWGWALILVCVVAAACGLPGGWDEVSYDRRSASELTTRRIRDAATGEGLTLVQVELEQGRRLWMILDSGSSVMLLDQRAARDLDLPERARIGVGGCGIRASVRTGSHFRVGPLTASDPVYVVLDLQRFLGELDAPVAIEGILGRPVFERSVVTIDYGPEKDRVFLGPPGSASVSEPGVISGFRHGRPAMRLRVSAAPDRVAWVALDTGKSGGLSLSSHFADRMGLPGDRPFRIEPNRRLCGVSDELAVELKWIELAGVRIAPAPIRVRIPGTEAARNEDPNDGVLGRAFLERFTVVLDFPRKRAALIPKNRRSVR